ncbi:MAG TPA: cold shock domain-containing protein [Candidatus Paceibacterota bacterium]|nr:cold shock domain-containing protein [Candidatus Paceibacterota bacterium]
MTGTVKKLLKDKYFGFIAVEGAKDLFFHANSLVGVQFDELNEGDTVSYDEDKSSPKGPSAINVQRA